MANNVKKITYKIDTEFNVSDLNNLNSQLNQALSGLNLDVTLRKQMGNLKYISEALSDALAGGFEDPNNAKAIKKYAQQFATQMQKIDTTVSSKGNKERAAMSGFNNKTLMSTNKSFQNKIANSKNNKNIQNNKTFQSLTSNLSTGNYQGALENVNHLKKLVEENPNSWFKDVAEELKVFQKELQKGVDALEGYDNAAKGVEKVTEETKQGAVGLGKMSDQADRLNRELHQIGDNVKAFFGLNNAIQIFKTIVRDAFNTVKDLDAVMTETAVVTDFSVGDMWDKLPEYTAMANELGATTKGAYETATLYYQQGLQENEVMAMTAETMKMARIAGLDYATATEYMTAAVRGFNMELNETSATRVNDVYSELAAITASDTEQISVAMTKVASLANSANMEFENTAAFLAQIIETTQESPETAGTALKTIIARFSELKSNPALTQDSEGEELNYNKIDEALKSVGISMDAFMNGQEGLDQVFMRLSKKWDTLSKKQKRYIATTAAGSRQQSRFVALMQNYDRTLELTGAAHDSAGASAEQFGKTQESLEAKLNRLKNAWDQFTMGIANNDLIKLAVDSLTLLLETINKIIEVVSGGNGLVKSIISLGLGMGALYGGNLLVSGTLGDLAKNFLKITTSANKTTGAFNAFGSIFGTLKGTVEKGADKIGYFGLSLKLLEPQAWAMVAAIGALIAAFVAYDKLFKNDTRKLENTDFTGDINAEENKLNQVNKSQKRIQKYEITLTHLKQGTQEWTEQTQKINDEIDKLIKKYPEYAKYVSLKDGKKTLDLNGIKNQNKADSDKIVQDMLRTEYGAAEEAYRATMTSGNFKGTNAQSFREDAETMDETEFAQKYFLPSMTAEEFQAAKDQALAYNKAKRNYENNISYRASENTQDVTGDTTTKKGGQIVKDNLKETLSSNRDLSTEEAEKYAKSWIKAAKEVEGFHEKIQNSAKVLSTTKKGSDEYTAAIRDIQTQAKEVFGDNVSEKWVEDNIDNFKAFAEGGEDAEEALEKIDDSYREMNIKDLSEDFKLDEGITNELLDIGDSIGDLEVGATLDDTGFTAALNSMLANGQVTMSQLEQMFPEMNFEMQEVDAESVSVSGDTRTIKYKDPFTGEEVTETIDASIKANNNGKYTIPVINGGSVKTSKKTFGNASAGTTNPTKGTKGGSGGGSSKPKRWKNPYDKYYNLNEKINETLRKREKLEKQMERILDKRSATYKEFSKNINQQLANTQKEIQYQKQLAAGKKSQIKNLKNQKYETEDGKLKSFQKMGVTKYAQYDFKTNTLKIDWSAINKLSKSTNAKKVEKGAAVEEYIKYLEEYSKAYEEAIDKQEEALDIQRDIYKEMREGASSAMDLVRDALVDTYQQTIDNYSSLADEISETNSNILDSLQESIDLERQIRDNTKQEDEIANMEQRLAFLRRDTSGANDLEIQQLEKQLFDARESYGDTLVDQELEKLNKVNEEADKQRQRQIEIAQAQLNWAQQTGVLWEHVAGYLVGSPKALEELIKNTSEYKEANEIEQKNMLEEARNGSFKFQQYTSNESKIAKKLLNSDGTVTKKGTKSATITNQNGNKITLTSNGDGTYTNKSTGSVYSNILMDENGTITSADVKEKAKYYSKLKSKNYNDLSKSELKNLISFLKSAGFYSGKSTETYTDGVRDAVKKLQKAVGVKATGRWGPKTYAALKKSGKYKKYLTGGLADFTGPAWLDGSPSKPELVLNAQDTANFLALKEQLAMLNKAGGELGANTNYINVQIEVGELGSDYDVEQLASKIKREITKDSKYRNINTINWRR